MYNPKFRNMYGRYTRRMRTNLGKSQAELAKELGCTAGYISQIELGKVTPSNELKARIDHMISLYGTC